MATVQSQNSRNEQPRMSSLTEVESPVKMPVPPSIPMKNQRLTDETRRLTAKRPGGKTAMRAGWFFKMQLLGKCVNTHKKSDPFYIQQPIQKHHSLTRMSYMYKTTRKGKKNEKCSMMLIWTTIWFFK